MGSTDASGRLDTGGRSAHHYDVRHGGDADVVPQAAPGQNSAAGLLRSKRVTAP